MPRRCRRSGISYVEDDKDRGLTFFKRRDGLFKTAADLSTLTGARIAVVVESENGKKSAFGTPSANPIIDSFLLGDAPTLINEETRPTITHLQNELFQLEKDKAMEDKRTRESMAHKKEIQETSRVAKLIYGDEKDLGVDELNELLHGLLRVQQDIQDRMHELHPGYQLEIGGVRDPSLQLSSSRLHSQIQLSPRHLPWTPLQPSSHLPQSSWPLPQSSRSQSSLLIKSSLPSPIMPPSPQAPPRQLLQHEAHTMPLPNEARLYNYHFTQSPTLSSQPPPPPSSSAPQTQSSIQFPPLSQSVQLQLPLPFPLEAEPHFGAQNFNPSVPSQNHANNCNVTAGDPFANYQWPLTIPSNEPYYDASLHGQDACSGSNGYYGGHATYGHDMPDPSGIHRQAYDQINMTLFESSSGGESSRYGARDSLGNMGPFSNCN